MLPVFFPVSGWHAPTLGPKRFDPGRIIGPLRNDGAARPGPVNSGNPGGVFPVAIIQSDWPTNWSQ
ncbi:hypothetical protein GCM10009738_38800 [Kitasatospora viridis]